MTVHFLQEHQREYLILAMHNLTVLRPSVFVDIPTNIIENIEDGKTEAEEFLVEYEHLKNKVQNKERKNMMFKYSQKDIERCIKSKMHKPYDFDINNVNELFYYTGFIYGLDKHLYNYFYLAFEKAFALPYAVLENPSVDNVQAFVASYNSVMADNFEVFCYNISYQKSKKKKSTNNSLNFELNICDDRLKQELITFLAGDYKIFLEHIKNIYQETLVKLLDLFSYLYKIEESKDLEEFNLKLLTVCYNKKIKTRLGRFPCISQVVTLPLHGTGFIICDQNEELSQPCLSESSINVLSHYLQAEFKQVKHLPGGKTFVKLY